MAVIWATIAIILLKIITTKSQEDEKPASSSVVHDDTEDISGPLASYLRLLRKYENDIYSKPMIQPVNMINEKNYLKQGNPLDMRREIHNETPKDILKNENSTTTFNNDIYDSKVLVNSSYYIHPEELNVKPMSIGPEVEKEYLTQSPFLNHEDEVTTEYTIRYSEVINKTKNAYVPESDKINKSNYNNNANNEIISNSKMKIQTIWHDNSNGTLYNTNTENIVLDNNVLVNPPVEKKLLVLSDNNPTKTLTEDILINKDGITISEDTTQVINETNHTKVLTSIYDNQMDNSINKNVENNNLEDTITTTGETNIRTLWHSNDDITNQNKYTNNIVSDNISTRDLVYSPVKINKTQLDFTFKGHADTLTESSLLNNKDTTFVESATQDNNKTNSSVFPTTDFHPTNKNEENNQSNYVLTTTDEIQTLWRQTNYDRNNVTQIYKESFLKEDDNNKTEQKPMIENPISYNGIFNILNKTGIDDTQSGSKYHNKSNSNFGTSLQGNLQEHLSETEIQNPIVSNNNYLISEPENAPSLLNFERDLNEEEGMKSETKTAKLNEMNYNTILFTQRPDNLALRTNATSYNSLVLESNTNIPTSDNVHSATTPSDINGSEEKRHNGGFFSEVGSVIRIVFG